MNKQVQIERQIFNEKSERYALGGCLMYGDIYETVRGIVTPNDFYYLKHRTILEAMDAVARRGEETDVAMVAKELGTMSDSGSNWLELLGGDLFLFRLEEEADLSGGHFEAFAQHVKELSARRNLMLVSNKLNDLAGRMDLSLSIIETESETMLTKVFEGGTGKPPELLGSALDTFLTNYMNAEMGKSSPMIYTGYNELDNPSLLGGFKRGDYVTIAGETSVGKTAFAVCLAHNMAKLGYYGIFISKEMGLDEMSSRFIAADAGISLIKLRKYTPEDKKYMIESFRKAVTLTDDEHKLMIQAIDNLSTMPLALVHKPMLTALDVWSEARRFKQRTGRLDFIFVDLITDMNADDMDRNSNRAIELGQISGRFKEMASESNLNAAVFALAQASPGIRERQNKRPQKNDFKNSTAIGDQADVQLFLYRDALYQETDISDIEAEVLVRKHRGGALGMAKLVWNAPCARYESQSENVLRR